MHWEQLEAKYRRRIAELEFMLGEIVYLHSDGTVRVSWRADADLTDQVPGIKELAKPVVPLSEHLRG